MTSVAGLAIIQDLDNIIQSEPNAGLVTICTILSRIVIRLEGITDSEHALRQTVSDTSSKGLALEQEFRPDITRLYVTLTASHASLNEQFLLFQSHLDNLHSTLHPTTPSAGDHLYLDHPPVWRAAHDWFCHHQSPSLHSPPPHTPPESNIFLDALISQFTCLLKDITHYQSTIGHTPTTHAHPCLNDMD
jgi:hypothetical protein